MTGIPLFTAELTGTCRLVLRRFCYGDRSGHRHDISIVIGEDEPATGRDVSGDRVPHDDPRWPSRCNCGQLFLDSDEWQVIEQEWYEGGGQRFTWGIAAWDGPPGAMIRAPWRDYEGRPPAWVVFLPNGTYWCTNDRASREGNEFGPYWDVTGEAPALTVHPSIDDRDPARPWHGWIRDGFLVPA